MKDDLLLTFCAAENDLVASHKAQDSLQQRELGMLLCRPVVCDLKAAFHFLSVVVSHCGFQTQPRDNTVSFMRHLFGLARFP